MLTFDKKWESRYLLNVTTHVELFTGRVFGREFDSRRLHHHRIIRFHDLRASWLTAMLSKGVEPMLSVYTSLTPSLLP